MIDSIMQDFLPVETCSAVVVDLDVCRVLKAPVLCELKRFPQLSAVRVVPGNV